MSGLSRRIGSIALVVIVASTGVAARLEHRWVDMGGFRLQLVTAGRGEPTVVFDSGLGSGAEAWSEVLPRVAKLTRVVAWDRAGVGRSEPSPSPRTASAIAIELREALARAEIPPPYVLVGHSVGGLNVRAFASHYPEATAGLVLVDATPEDFPEKSRSLMAPAERIRFETSLQVESEGVRGEYEALARSIEELRNAPPLPSRPVVVVTSEKFEGPPERRALWHTLQRELVARIPGAIQLWAPDSGHRIPFEQPHLVIDAVRRVIEAVREGRGLRDPRPSSSPPRGPIGTAD